MRTPVVSSGVKERHQLAADGIESRGLVVFEIVAALTCEREVVGRRFSSGDEWGNVLD
jgi:hypothetical protein